MCAPTSTAVCTNFSGMCCVRDQESDGSRCRISVPHRHAKFQARVKLSDARSLSAVPVGATVRHSSSPPNGHAEHDPHKFLPLNRHAEHHRHHHDVSRASASLTRKHASPRALPRHSPHDDDNGAGGHARKGGRRSGHPSPRSGEFWQVGQLASIQARSSKSPERYKHNDKEHSVSKQTKCVEMSHAAAPS